MSESVLINREMGMGKRKIELISAEKLPVLANQRTAAATIMRNWENHCAPNLHFDKNYQDKHYARDIQALREDMAPLNLSTLQNQAQTVGMMKDDIGRILGREWFSTIASKTQLELWKFKMQANGYQRKDLDRMIVDVRNAKQEKNVDAAGKPLPVGIAETKEEVYRIGQELKIPIGKGVETIRKMHIAQQEQEAVLTLANSLARLQKGHLNEAILVQYHGSGTNDKEKIMRAAPENRFQTFTGGAFTATGVKVERGSVPFEALSAVFKACGMETYSQNPPKREYFVLGDQAGEVSIDTRIPHLQMVLQYGPKDEESIFPSKISLRRS